MSGPAGDAGPSAGSLGSRRNWLIALAVVAVALVAAGVAYFGAGVRTPGPTSSPLTLKLAAGCDRTYYPGEMLDIQVESPVDGQVDVYWTDPEGRQAWLYHQEVQADIMAPNEWPVDGVPGTWILEVSLDDGQANATCAFFVDTEFSVLYDFVREAQHASWSVFAPRHVDLSWAGPITSPLGFAGWHYDAVLEDGSGAIRLLETRPPEMPYGEIWGRYDLGRLAFQPGDRFSARVGLLQGAEWGEVVFRVQIHDGALGSVPIFTASVPDRYLGDLPEQWIRQLDFPLPYALSDKFFYLQVDAGSVPRYDRAVWIEARIERPSTSSGP